MENQPTVQPTDPKKFPVVVVIIIAVVATAIIVGGGVYFWQAVQLKTAQENLASVQQSLQQQITNLQAQLGQQVTPSARSEDQIENWSLYQENTSVQVGTGKCGSQEFDSFLDRANAGSRKVLNISGLTLVVTPNYNNWSNEKFVGFNNDSTAICGAGGIYPLRAYADKLLWRGVCGTGAAPEPEEPDYVAKVAALNRCEQTLDDVTQYLSGYTISKPTVTTPRSGVTVEKAPEGVKIVGKAAPDSTVWLFQVSEMDPNCLNMASALTLGDMVNANGNFEIDYTPSGEAENWPSEFAVVSLDENQKYQLNWVNGVFCAPDEAKSDYFQLTLKP